MDNGALSAIGGGLQTAFNLLITLLIWIYFTLGFLLFFSPFYAAALLFSKNREAAFQRLNSRFCRSFFRLLRILIPGLKWKIPRTLHSLRSSIIVCNHLSYLDPLLLISLFPVQKTIVKGIFFKVPIFGTMLKFSGYIPASKTGGLSPWMLERMEAMEEYLASGGVLFIFPEGTRSRNGRIGSFQEGAFKLAKRFKAPIQALYLQGTGDIFQPGKFLFCGTRKASLQIKRIGTIEPDCGSEAVLISRLTESVHRLYEKEEENSG